MAFYSDDEEEKNQAASGQTVNKPGSGIVGGTASAPLPGTAAPGEAAKSSTPGNASPFVGINEYLNANKQQSGKLGNTVSNYVGGKIDTAGQHLGEAEQNFGKQVEAGTPNINDNNLVKAIERDPNQVLKDSRTLGQVRGIQKGYTGPTDFKSDATYQAVDPEIKKAQQNVTNLGTPTGQTQILRNQQAENRGGKINRGAATLDQALLSASPEARPALQAAAQKGQDFNNNINTTIQNAMNRVTGAQNQSAATGQALKQAFDQQFAGQQEALQNKVNQTNAGLAAGNQAIKQRVLNGDVTDQDLSMLGIGRGDYDSLRGDLQQYVPDSLDSGYGRRTDALGNYLNFSNSNANIQNVAAPEDYARADALKQLAGYGGDYLSNPSQAGTYNKDLVDFDLGGAKNYLSPLKAASAKKAQDEADRVALLRATSGVAGVTSGLNDPINKFATGIKNMFS